MLFFNGWGKPEKIQLREQTSDGIRLSLVFAFDERSSTIGYELKRGTKEYSGKGRRPTYTAKHGNAIYKENRRSCHRNKTVPRASAFIDWMSNKVKRD